MRRELEGRKREGQTQEGKTEGQREKKNEGLSKIRGEKKQDDSTTETLRDGRSFAESKLLEGKTGGCRNRSEMQGGLRPGEKLVTKAD